MPVRERDQRCSGCAFTKGSEANSEPRNFIVATLAMLGPFPFYCHEDIDWRNETGGRKTRAEFVEKEYQLCAGWREKVRELAGTGYYKDHPMITKVYAQVALENLEIFLSTDDPEDKAEAQMLLTRTLEQLVKKEQSFSAK